MKEKGIIENNVGTGPCACPEYKGKKILAQSSLRTQRNERKGYN